MALVHVYFEIRGILDVNKVRLALGLALALAVAPTAQAATLELVTNGGFETGDATGWSVSPDSFCVGASRSSHTGIHSFEVGCEKTVSQMLATEAGVLYNISFWVRSLEPTDSFFDVTFGATTLVSVTNFYVPYERLNSGYQQFSFGYVAASSDMEELRFNFNHSTFAFLLDDVSVTAVPVPGALPLLLAGLGGLGVVGRRSRKKSA